MDGPRTPTLSEAPTLIDFLNRHLRPETGWSIQDEYPTTFAAKNLQNLHIITDKEKVLSHAATRHILLKTPQVAMKIAAIGSVVTSDLHRRQGLSQALLTSCIEKATEAGADLAILWTDLYDFYRKLGFELAGHEVSFLIDRDLDADDSGLIIREGANVSPEAILRVYNKHTVTSFRTAEDIAKYLKIPNSRIYTAWDRQGFLQAYAVEGKGADLNGYVHEWGGGVSQLLPLFTYIRRSQQKPLTVIAPAHAQTLQREFEKHGVPNHHGYLGMIRLLNFDSVKAKVTRYTRAMGVDGFVLEKDTFGVHVGWGDDQMLLTRPGQLERFLFGPDSLDLIAKLKPASQEALAPLFPLHLWVWGWDSI